MAIAGERDASFWDFRPPQGESYEDVAQRVLSFARELKGPAIIVAHGGVLRILRRLIEDFPAERAMWFRRRIRWCTSSMARAWCIRPGRAGTIEDRTYLAYVYGLCRMEAPVTDARKVNLFRNGRNKALHSG